MMTAHPSKRACFLVWAALVSLALLNWRLAEAALGSFNLVVALGIAFTQMLLMVFFFMGVAYEKRLTWIFVCAGAIWLVIMIDMTLADYLTRPGPIYQLFHNGF